MCVLMLVSGIKSCGLPAFESYPSYFGGRDRGWVVAQVINEPSLA